MMELPIRTTLDDVTDVCGYLATKPTGATIKEAKAVLDSKRLDGRKLRALKFWGLIAEEDGGRLKLTSSGRELVRGEPHLSRILLEVIRGTPPYAAIIERAAHRHEDSLTTTEVAAHWHDHFRQDVSDNDKILNDQVVCFFHLAAGASLGTLIPGRRGTPTRFSFSAEALGSFVRGSIAPKSGTEDITRLTARGELGETGLLEPEEARAPTPVRPLGQAIFIGHGKNKKPLEQLKKVLDQFKIPYKVAVEEPNLGRPISGKVREVMQSCNCAILIFTADEQFTDASGKSIHRPSENVVYELGAAGYLYDQRIVIMKEEGVDFPANFRDLGYIAFEKDGLGAKALDILKELVGFGIVKVST